MGVVRREGDWRLEKRDNGEYEITYQREVQLSVLTPDYQSGLLDNPGMGMVPVRTVGSYAEAEGLFEEKSQGGTPFGMGGTGGPSLLADERSTVGTGLNHSGSGIDFDDVDLPPGGFALVLMAMGALIVATADFAIGSTTFLVGALFVVGGLTILGWAGLIYRMEGWEKSREFLTKGRKPSSSTNNDNSEKTPAPSQKIKDTLFFERANQECEWCGNHLDNAEVHHIKPRSEGGPNTAANLIVLCPNCHQKAHGTISRSKLRYKVRQRMDEWDGSL